MKDIDYVILDLQKRLKHVEREQSIWFQNRENEMFEEKTLLKRSLMVLEFKLDNRKKFKELVAKYRDHLVGLTKKEHTYALWKIITDYQHTNETKTKNL